MPKRLNGAALTAGDQGHTCVVYEGPQHLDRIEPECLSPRVRPVHSTWSRRVDAGDQFRSMRHWSPLWPFDCLRMAIMPLNRSGTRRHDLRKSNIPFTSPQNLLFYLPGFVAPESMPNMWPSGPGLTNHMRYGLPLSVLNRWEKQGARGFHPCFGHSCAKDTARARFQHIEKPQ